MCLGLPMTIVETDGVSALCEYGNERRRVSVLLLSEPPVGANVLVYIDTAMRLLDDDEARLIAAALQGLGAALIGQEWAPFFADLVNRDPQLPEHLRSWVRQSSTTIDLLEG
ncbi:HypC/HybG/HupF family hydrogenase formation chaperone [Bradyrhizobium sp. Ai1a-2]|uniref:HypC/HybG/HupF family hydrogenase formation chaperone n=1 Tax=Bradyrhizobium sp. Ai1a-2 TaxID=196490 RepID=UPI0003FFD3B5|nr:HypC/HybG/HupF family hydrogenase formation chaperone [Bradyrhizobium sp. Ai1a-2]